MTLSAADPARRGDVALVLGRDHRAVSIHAPAKEVTLRATLWLRLGHDF